ncbi:MAG: hypothetical protein IJY15_04980, partial [Thermoguttaceae bacterium]|nr:hypothetical protein [Thermoguttaceae bacterium]
MFRAIGADRSVGFVSTVFLTRKKLAKTVLFLTLYWRVRRDRREGCFLAGVADPKKFEAVNFLLEAGSVEPPSPPFRLSPKKRARDFETEKSSVAEKIC